MSAYASPSLNTLNTLLSQMHTFQADFIQTTTDAHGKKIQQSVGSMVLARPGQFRWEVKKPIPQLILTDGKRLWVYDPDLEQVTIHPLSKQVGDTPALLLMNPTGTLDNDFKVQPMISSDSSQRFLLTPRHSDSLLSAVELGFSRGVISEIHLEDHMGHRTIIQFSHIFSNLSVSPHRFQFVPPKGVDIIN